MRFDDALTLLSQARFRPLPGSAAQATMAPRPRPSWDPGIVPEGARAAAGLALLYPRDGMAMLLLTLRGDSLPTHGGQVSLPGGAIDPGESIEDAALREADEEVGLDPKSVELRLRLTPLHIPVSGFVLHPVVASSSFLPAVAPRGAEVQRIVEASIAGLIGQPAPPIERRSRAGVPIEVPYFDLGGIKLWGATAMVVAELLAVLGASIDPWSADQRLP